MTTETLASAVRPMPLSAKFGDTTIVEMELETWIALASHPRARDASRAARAPHWESARSASGVVLEVMRHVMAVEHRGQQYKLDGHVRTELWATGRLPRPDTVVVTVFCTEDPQAFGAVYAGLRPPTSGLRSVDRAFGAYRSAKLELTSRRLRDGTIGDALNLALRGAAAKHQPSDSCPIDFYKAVALFADALRALDEFDIGPELFQSGVLAGALVLVSLDPTRTLPFFRAVAAREGQVRDGLNDPVRALVERIEASTPSRARWIKKQQEQLLGITLAAYARWSAGGDSLTGEAYWSNEPLKPIDSGPTIARLRKRHVLDDVIDL